MIPRAKSKVLVPLLLALLALGAAMPAGATVPDPAAPFVPGEVVVRFAPSVPAAERSRALAQVGARTAAVLDGVPRTRVVRLDPGVSVAAAVRELGGEPGVAWAEPNYISHVAALPDDPRLDELWGLRNVGQGVEGRPAVAGMDVGALGAWARLTGGARVAVIDTGIDPTHPDLAANLRADLSRNFVPRVDQVVDPSDWADGQGHGTHVAGTIAAVGDNGIGTVGVAWQAELVAVRACTLGGTCTTAALAEAFAYAGTVGARIANASVGGPHSLAERAAIAANPQTLYVVAAGNDGVDVDEAPTYPCSFDLANVVCVAAIDQTGALAGFSNRGVANVDLGAPGTEILSTEPPLHTPFEDDFSGGLDRWSAAPAGSWVAVDPDDDPAVIFDADPPLPAQSTLTLDETVSLTDMTHCALRYGLAIDTAVGSQRLLVEASAGGGDWRAVQTSRNGYSGSSQDRVLPLTEPLEGFDGQAAVQLRFRLAVDAASEDDPAVVEIFEPRVTCLGDHDDPDGAYGFQQGTSMASPHVAGVASLVAAAHTGATTADLRAALLDSVTVTPALVGNTVTGGRVDALGAIAALDPAPPAPVPPPQPPEPVTPAGSAAAFAAARLVRVTPSGRAVVRLRCGTVRLARCAGRLTLTAVVRRQGARGGVGGRRIVLGARAFSVPKGRTARLSVWLRPRPQRLLRAGRLAAFRLRAATRQPAAADARVRTRTATVRLRVAGRGRGPVSRRGPVSGREPRGGS